MSRTRAYVGWGIAMALVAGVLIPRGFAEGARVLQGEIVDPAAYLHNGSHGPERVNQTYEALDGGQTLALLEDGTETLYLLLAEEPGEDPNELVYDYVNQRLKVTGTVYERAGMKGLVIQAVEPLVAADTPAVEPQATVQQ